MTQMVQANPSNGVVSVAGKVKRHRVVGTLQRGERGMATAEYAVGILAAVALALVLIKIFNAASFLNVATNLVGGIFDKILGWLPK